MDELESILFETLNQFLLEYPSTYTDILGSRELQTREFFACTLFKKKTRKNKNYGTASIKVSFDDITVRSEKKTEILITVPLKSFDVKNHSFSDPKTGLEYSISFENENIKNSFLLRVNLILDQKVNFFYFTFFILF